jgi:ABC-2 type transport system ATP-binding protein
MSELPIAIRVADLDKTFHIPEEQSHTLKERALHPFRRSRYNDLNVLRNISFEIRQGEFFGIVGRNGSGKSTLLKCMAGIYGIDRGAIHLSGQLAPFIELGVGFNHELPARDNIEINAVMMGLNPSVVRDRFDEIIHFGGLEGFVDQKLKNYSSGMQVRLAFSIMVHSDPDIMLIDEVLAVGDAAFQQKCLDVFNRLKHQGKTIVLVTHSMGQVEQFCDRAMMLSDGDIKVIGDPGEVGRAYLAENFASRHRDIVTGDEDPTDRAQIVDAWIESGGGTRVDAVEYGQQFTVHIEIEAIDAVTEPGIALWVATEDGVRVFSVGAHQEHRRLDDLSAGERITCSITAINPLTAGRYHIGCSVVRGSAGLDIIMHQARVTDFVSWGSNLVGLIGLDYQVAITRRGAHKVMAG